jgi:syntaxin 5
MVARDRTKEFLEVTEHFKRSGLVVTTSKNAPLRAAAGGAPSDGGGPAAFRALASEIGSALEATASRLSQLTTLARRRSLFDDPSAEIGRLTSLVKTDIQSLNGALEELAGLRATMRGGGMLSSGSAAAQRGGGEQAEAHAGTVVDALKGRLMDTTKEFQGVLEVRSGNMKAQSQRRQEFSSIQGGAAGGLTRRGGAGPAAAAAAASTGSGEVRLDMPESRMQSQDQMVLQQDDYYSTRADAVETIESTIVELGSIFNQLATMVSEQGELVQRIDEDVTAADRNVNAAQDQLLRYMESVSSNRGLMLKIFGMLILFIITFVMVS